MPDIRFEPSLAPIQDGDRRVTGNDGRTALQARHGVDFGFLKLTRQLHDEAPVYHKAFGCLSHQLARRACFCGAVLTMKWNFWLHMQLTARWPTATSVDRGDVHLPWTHS